MVNTYTVSRTFELYSSPIPNHSGPLHLCHIDIFVIRDVFFCLSERQFKSISDFKWSFQQSKIF